MYTVVERRKMNAERYHEAGQRARSEYFPQLQAAPGFIGFYLVEDEANGINTAVIVWESKAQADAFEPENSRFMRTLEEMGHTLQSDNRGETIITVEARS
jgi:heme-degrading monooxygenase HmoA